MLPYHSLEALVAVIDKGSFQKAASALRITQSAVSQRIAFLEDQLGERLIVRANPPKPTERGLRFISHARHVMEMEHNLTLGNNPEDLPKQKMRLGINADSLETWFFEAVKDLIREENYLLELVVENEEFTFARMQAGEFFSCISSQEKSLPGCEVELLGKVEYKCYCTPSFKKENFPKGTISEEDSKIVAAVLFDTKDFVHHRFLKKIGINNMNFPNHYVPTSKGFMQTILSGMAYGVLPVIQAKDELARGKLLNLYPKVSLEMPWFWHFQRKELPHESKFRKLAIKRAKEILDRA